MASMSGDPSMAMAFKAGEEPKEYANEAGTASLDEFGKEDNF